MKQIIIFLLLGFTTNTVFSQGWIKPKGSGYAQIGYSTINASKIYGVENIEEQLRREVTDQTVQGYLEYGLGNKLMISASVPFKMLKTGSEIFETNYLPDTLSAGSINSIGNISVAVIYGIKQNSKWVSSVGIGLDTKTATFDREIGLRTGADAWAGLLNFNLGRSWRKTFFQMNAGVKLRSNNYSEQFISSAQYGATFNKFQVIFGVEMYQSMNNGSFNDETSVHTGLYQNDLSFLSFSLKANYAINDKIKLWGVVGGGLLGELVARAPAYTISLSYEWNKR